MHGNAELAGHARRLGIFIGPGDVPLTVEI